MSDDVLRVVTLAIASLFGLWTAVACRRAQYHGLPGSDALIWAGLSAAFFLLSLLKTARGLGLLRGFFEDHVGSAGRIFDLHITQQRLHDRRRVFMPARPAPQSGPATPAFAPSAPPKTATAPIQPYPANPH